MKAILSLSASWGTCLDYLRKNTETEGKKERLRKAPKERIRERRGYGRKGKK